MTLCERVTHTLVGAGEHYAVGNEHRDGFRASRFKNVFHDVTTGIGGGCMDFYVPATKRQRLGQGRPALQSERVRFEKIPPFFYESILYRYYGPIGPEGPSTATAAGAVPVELEVPESHDCPPVGVHAEINDKMITDPSIFTKLFLFLTMAYPLVTLKDITRSVPKL